MTRLPILATAAIGLCLATPAFSQSLPTHERPLAARGEAVGLPGVNLSATTTTDRPSGPGGLSNGVGAQGTLMPNSSSSNGQLLNDNGQGNGIGIALDGPGGVLGR